MFDAVFTSLGPLGSAVVLLVLMAPVFVIGAMETVRVGGAWRRPRLLALAFASGARRVACVPRQGDSAGRDELGRALQVVSARVRGLLARLGAGAAAQRPPG